MAARRVLIRVDGTRDIGLGHVVRMCTLGLALRDRGDGVTVATRRNTVGAKLMAEAGLAVRELPDPPSLSDLAEVAAAVRSNLTVVDTLETTDAELAALRGGRLVVFDDWGAGLRTADAVINAIVFHWGRYCREDAGTKLFEGPAYMILSPDIAARAAQVPAIAPTARRLFLAFGGTDTRGLTPRMLDLFSRLSGPLEVRVNLGPGAEGAGEVRAAAARSPHRIQILAAASSLADEFAAADLAVCGGGNMLYELAALGVPAAALATEEHEVLNVRYWANAGSAADLGDWRAFEPGRIAAAIAALIADRAARAAMSAAGRTAVDGGGLARCLAVLDGLAA